jgi:Tol biopolymer transport system component
MFINNDVAITGTSALVYYSCQPSFITSGAHLYFDVGTTFSVAPATFTDCPYSYRKTYTASNFIRMADATSVIIFNGSSFSTTPTGLRLTTGTVLFDNRVSLNSKASSDLASTNTSPVKYIGGTGTGMWPVSVSWSPDGRFLAVVNWNSNSLQIFSFSGGYISATPVGSASTGLSPVLAVWSPDGRFIAVVNETSSTLQLQIFSVTSGVPSSTPVGAVNTGTVPVSVSWSPDGRFLAVVNYGGDTLQIFSFNGFGNPILVGTATGLNSPQSVSWSPDGRFIAVVNSNSSTLQLQIFSVTGGVPSSTPVGTVTTGTQPESVSWSPDGRFLAVVNASSNSLQIFSFYGGNPAIVGSQNTGSGSSPYSVSWSPDGRFLAVVSEGIQSLQIFRFSGVGNPTQVGGNIPTGQAYSVSWSPDGRFIAVVNSNNSTVQAFGVNYIVSQTPQALSNSIVFGNSALGSNYDATVDFLSGSNVILNGQLNVDNVS